MCPNLPFHCVKRVVLSISPYLVQMRENTDQKNSEYGHFSRNVRILPLPLIMHTVWELFYY